MIVFPNAKINLGLRVLARRSDGYHDIETVVLPVGLFDGLEVVAREGERDGERSTGHSAQCSALSAQRSVHSAQRSVLSAKRPALSAVLSDQEGTYTRSGLAVPGRLEDDLVVRAFVVFREYAEGLGLRLPRVGIHLHKCIPPGSGLGGGSADAAFLLQLLADMFVTGRAANKKARRDLLRLSAGIGSDCPFFFYNQPMQVTGRGETIRPVSIPALEQMTLALVMPAIHISTAEAYAATRPRRFTLPVIDAVHQEPEQWKELIYNDFEPWVFQNHPTIKKIKEGLYCEGAVYASLSGSGSAVYGLFRGRPHDGLQKALQIEKNVAFLQLTPGTLAHSRHFSSL